MTVIVTVFAVSIFLAWVFLLVTVIWPAKKSLAATRARANMTRCLVELNREAFLTGHVQNGHYLHDKFYKFLLCAISQDNMLNEVRLNELKYDQKAEEERRKLRAEIDGLANPVKEVVDRAISSIATKFITDTPLMFFRMLIRHEKLRRDYKKHTMAQFSYKRRVVESAEYITVAAPCPHHPSACPSH